MADARFDHFHARFHESIVNLALEVLGHCIVDLEVRAFEIADAQRHLFLGEKWVGPPQALNLGRAFVLAEQLTVDS